MRHIIFFFFVQTALLVTWFHYPFPTVLKLDFNKILFNFCESGRYQYLNIGFLISLLVQERKSLITMLHFVIRRESWFSLLVLFFYLSLITVFLLPQAFELLYKGGIIVIAVLSMFFPRIFPKDILSPGSYRESDMSFELKGKGGQSLPINFPETGIFILGAAGSGKTKSVVEPILFKMTQKGYAGLLYDYDFYSEKKGSSFSLSLLAYNAIQQTNQKTKFFSINFEDLDVSSRFNPILPEFIKERENLSNSIKTLLLNLSPYMAQKEDFWQKNAYVLLKSIVVFLANKYPSCCTLPHAILLGLQDSDTLMAALRSDDEAAMYASPVLDAHKVSNEQFAGVIANFKVLLENLVNKKVFWVLSGSDVPLVVNDADSPSIISLGNSPTKKNFISPILSVVMSSLINQMYSHDRQKSFIMIDELPTIILPQLSEVPATARKYKISTVVALQNMPQLEKAYSNVGAREVQESFSNQFFGRSSLASSEELSRMIGKREVEATSTTKSEQRESKTIQKKEELLLTPQQAMSLETGEFVGRVVSQKGGFFNMKLAPLEKYKIKPRDFKSLPKVHLDINVEENFRKIEKDVKEILKPFDR
jgi:hypothetical protein